MKTYPYRFLIYSGLALLMFGACKSNESISNPDLPLSRLLVSLTTPDSSTAGLSVYVPADGNSLPASKSLNILNPDANGITFDAKSGFGFQLSRLNKVIKTFNINTDGSLRQRNAFADTTMLSPQAIAHDDDLKNLYISSNADSSIYIYNNSTSRTGDITATKTFKLTGQPWGISFNDKRLMVVMDLNDKAVRVFNEVDALDSASISASLTFPSATRLHGICYAAASDILILTDIGEATATGFNSDGAIYIIEGANAKIAAGGTITPTRTIKGTATMLGNPVAVTVDDREGKGLIYVAEKANSRILGFKLSDDGNVAPYLNQSLSTPPESVWVDAR